MQKISKQEIEDIFKDSEFKLRFDTREEYECNYCYIERGDESLCALRGKISDSPAFDKIAYMGYNKKTRQINNNTENDCRMAFMTLTLENRQRIFDVLDLRPVSKFEQRFFESQQQEKKKLEEMLALKPQYATFNQNNEVFMVGQREHLILENAGFSQFIGTQGLGPCVGVGIIARQAGKVQRVGLTHIDALSSLTSLNGFIWNATKNSDNIEVVMISSKNERQRAREILKQILLNPEDKRKSTVVSELDGSTSLAINTTTGSIYKNIPAKCFIESQKANARSTMAMMMPSDVYASEFYDTKKRQIAQEFHHQDSLKNMPTNSPHTI